ncbi:DUF4382 domain-containing protein [Spirochaetota bacterium]
MKKVIFVLAVLFGMLAFFSCSSNIKDAKLNVRIVDAPITLKNGLVAEEVNVVIKRVDVLKKGSCEENATQAKDGDGVFTVLETDITLNLLDYQNGASYLLGSVTLEAGEYLQLRLVVDSNSSTIKFQDDNASYYLKVPSGGQSGIKIKGNARNPLFTIEEGEEADLVFDFDVMNSIKVHQTNKDKYILRPVIKEIRYRNRILTGFETKDIIK